MNVHLPGRRFVNFFGLRMAIQSLVKLELLQVFPVLDFHVLRDGGLSVHIAAAFLADCLDQVVGADHLAADVHVLEVSDP